MVYCTIQLNSIVLVSELIREYVADGKPKKAIRTLKDGLKENNREDLNEVILIESNLSRAEKEARMSIITKNEYDVRVGRVCSTILEMIDEINFEDFDYKVIDDQEREQDQEPRISDFNKELLRELKLDKILKHILRIMAAVSVLGLIYCSILVDDSWNRLFFVLIFLIVFVGSIIGFYYWKILELSVFRNS